MGGAENPPPAPQHDATAPRKRKDSLDKLARKDSKRSKKAKAQLNSILSRLDALEKVASGSVEVVYAENGDGDGGDDDAEPDEDEDEDKDEAIELMLEEIMVEMSSFNTACISALCTRGAARRTAPSRRLRAAGTTENVLVPQRQGRGDAAATTRGYSAATGVVRDGRDPRRGAERRRRTAPSRRREGGGGGGLRVGAARRRTARSRRRAGLGGAATRPRNIHASTPRPVLGISTRRPAAAPRPRPRNIHAAPRPRRNVEDARSPRAGRADRRGSRCSVY